MLKCHSSEDRRLDHEGISFKPGSNEGGVDLQTLAAKALSFVVEDLDMVYPKQDIYSSTHWLRTMEKDVSHGKKLQVGKLFLITAGYHSLSIVIMVVCMPAFA